MSKARPRDFGSEGQYETVSVDAGLVVKMMNEAHIVVGSIEADRVLAGGGLPDEAIEVLEDPTGRMRADFSDVDVCVRHDDGDTVVWLAP